MTDKLLNVYVPFIGKQRNDDGTLTVFGKCAGPDLDGDQQVMNEAWLKAALPQWFATGANVREQHQQLAAGVGTELTQDGNDWFLKSTIVDPVTISKIEHKVLNGYSAGIRNGKVFMKSARAPRGEIVGGDIVEMSVVDRGANETCRLTIAKAVDTGELVQLDEPEYVVFDSATKTWIADPDSNIIKANWKGTGGLAPLDPTSDDPDDARYPIKTAKDLNRAMRALGRVKEGDRKKVIAHIKARANALGLADKLTDVYKSLAGEIDKSATPEEYTQYINAALSGLAQLIISEAQELATGEDERCDISQLLNAVYALWCFWESEASEGEVPPPNDKETMNMGDISLSAVADLVKAATADDATDEDRTLVADLRKALGVPEGEFISKTDSDEIVKAAVADAMKGVEERFAAMEKSAAPGGPVKTRTTEDTSRASVREFHLAEAERLEKSASATTDRDLASGYIEMARSHRTQADDLLK